ncbi:MAG TPA: ATP-binding protein [Bacteroidales bacterium]|jgi:signal transduction histidine kinase|nr:ATP-binding protein [Bacteroidales bacterium]
MSRPGSGDKLPKSWLILILLASLLVITGAFAFYNIQRSKILKQTYSGLEVITSLKAEEIRKWRLEHIRDGYIVSNYLPIGSIADLLRDKEISENVRKDLLQRMAVFIENYDYHSIIIVDRQGKIRLIFPEPDKLTDKLEFLPLEGFNSGDIEFSDLHYSKDMNGMHIDMSIPVLPPEGSNSLSFGTIILRIDPEVTLFPTIRLWPSPGKTAETLLVRQDGDSITYLTNINKITNRPLKRSMHDRSLPAVAAVQGREGIFEGTDYNNVRVLSYIRKIPNSPWFMVAKISRDEALSVFHRQSVMLLIMVILFIMSFVAIAFYLWRDQKSKFYKELGTTKDKFVSIISHDLMNPFTSIVGFSDFLVSELGKGDYIKAGKFAGIIHDSSLSALDLIRNLAQWSKVQTSQIRLNKSEFDVSLMIMSAAGLMKASADRKSITLRTDIPGELFVHADKEMISTIMRNLISNSIKFTKPGGQVLIHASKGRDETIIDVEDTGVGISRDMLEMLFREGDRFSMPGTMNEAGTGLGLSLCKEFVSLHGGKISAKSEPGKGSRFTFTIPAENSG